MRAINLFIFPREVKEDLIALYEKSLSHREKELSIRSEEIQQIKSLVNSLINCDIDKEKLNKWFYSFTIPQISKEFDLLKIGKNRQIVNIELKSQEVSMEKIEEQLIKNRYYLNHIADKVYSFTCVRGSNDQVKVFSYKDCSLIESDISDIKEAIDMIEGAVEDDIEKLFSPKKFLISPFNTPKKFVNGKYFLNAQQEKIKKEIEESINSISEYSRIFGIKGSAGTGKSLLLYDVAKSLSNNYNVGIIHCRQLNEGHKILNRFHLKNMSIIDAKTITSQWISNHDVICVDEAQRLYSSSMDLILDSYNIGTIRGCIFSYDSAQELTFAEMHRDNIKRLNSIPGFNEKVLTGNIRSNREIYSFIRGVLRLTDQPKERIEYKNIEVIYANDYTEADIIIKSYEKNGFQHITYTPSTCVHGLYFIIDHYSHCVNSHEVIGQEFDSVLIVMDKSFRYNEKYELEGKEHPNPNYSFARLFYQNISRAKEKLCIVVIDNLDLFDKLLNLKEDKLNFKKIK